MLAPIVVNAHVTIPVKDLTWSASRASGPGGQNVNKVASKVELRFDLPRTLALDAASRSRLRAQAAGRLDAEGRILIVSQVTRDQPRNLQDACDRLRTLVLKALERPVERRATKPTRASKRRRLDDKSRRASTKANRSSRGDD